MAAIISVIIPAYNRQELSERAIASVLQQATDSLELIVVDDASSPPFFLPDEHEHNPQIRVIRHEKNKGAAAARNTGIKAAAGKFIAFLDSDDFWRPGKLDAQLQLAQVWLTQAIENEKPNDLFCVVSGFELKSSVTSSHRILQPVPSNKLSDFVSGCWFCPGSTLLIPKIAYDIVGGYDESLRRLEDLDWFIRFGQASGKMYVAEGNFVCIEAGDKPHPDVIQQANKMLYEKFLLGQNGAEPISTSELKLLQSYLALELASSQFAHNKKLSSILNLARSFFLKPRGQLHLRKWWKSKA